MPRVTFSTFSACCFSFLSRASHSVERCFHDPSFRFFSQAAGRTLAIAFEALSRYCLTKSRQWDIVAWGNCILPFLETRFHDTSHLHKNEHRDRSCCVTYVYVQERALSYGTATLFFNPLQLLVNCHVAQCGIWMRVRHKNQNALATFAGPHVRSSRS